MQLGANGLRSYRVNDRSSAGPTGENFDRSSVWRSRHGHRGRLAEDPGHPKSAFH